MVELAIRQEPVVQVKLFKTSEESETGADWHWWITDGHRAVSLLIQAKKLEGAGYSHLDHVVKGSGKRQIDLLIDACTVGTPNGDTTYVGSEPLLIFYNGDLLAQGFPGDRCLNDGVDQAQRGCSVARAREVRNALDAEPGAPHKSATQIMPLTWPWRCLFCCEQLKEASIVDRALAMFGGSPGESGRWQPRVETNPDVRVWMARTTPDYVRWLMTNDIPGDADEDLLFGDRRSPTPAARRVALFYQRPGDSVSGE